MMLRVLQTVLTFLPFFATVVVAQPAGEPVLLNQLGFYPKSPKIALVRNASSDTYTIRLKGTSRAVFSGQLGPVGTNPHSGKQARVADFSALQTPGIYEVYLSDGAVSPPFEIRENIHRELAHAALKGFYYQRASTPLPGKYAGKWHRPAGHPDTVVFVHPSASSPNRPAGARIASPGGWYDAGDYNKYVVNSGITTATLLALYEDFPQFTRGFAVRIPESGNRIPDLLDEALWNIRWLLTMQDPGDGGVYHKLTNPKFDGTVMPHAAREIRYVVQKSVTATLDFAAVMAQSARIFGSFKRQLPGLSDSCLAAAEKAWIWAENNPQVYYDQGFMNRTFDPDIVTGAYGDRNSADELTWAAAELYLTTRNKKYLTAIDLQATSPLPVPSWSQVLPLACYSLLRHERTLPSEAKPLLRTATAKLLAAADALSDDLAKTPFYTAMGRTAGDFVWGSNAVAANQGILLLQAYRLTNKTHYLHTASGNLDYLLGRNATGYCFVTGFGSKRVLHPHHRPSAADAVAEPVPGLLAGGPNPGQQDQCNSYPGNNPDESYTDVYCSYASNEIAINWNAPLVYLSWALEALHEK